MVQDTISVTVLLFAGVADAAGVRQVNLQLPAGARLADAVCGLVEQFPALTPWLNRVSFARNLEIASLEVPLTDGDEIALLPPVSGGESAGTGDLASLPLSADQGRLLITAEPLSLDRARELVTNPRAGAVCVFAGTVRQFTGSRETYYLEYDAYPPMVICEMRRLSAEVTGRWPGVRIAFHHRVGKLPVGEISVVVAAAAPHRAEAFAAARFGIDELKRRLPVWKKEIQPGGSYWVGG